MGFRQDGPHNLPFIYPPLTDSRERGGGAGHGRRETEQKRGEEERKIVREWGGKTG